MLQLLPFLPLLAPIISAALLGALWVLGGLRPSAWSVLVVWFLAAAYCQFFGGSALVAALGLAAQTLLAIGLIVWWKFTSGDGR